MVGVRHSYMYIKNQFEKEGYKLLSDTYVNNMQHLDFICPNGHKHFITWSNWKNGFRCGKCARNVKFTIEFIKSCFEKEGYSLLVDEYINQKQKLKYICSLGHVNETMFSDWYYGNCRCSMCRSVNMSGKGNHQWKGGISCGPYCDAWADKEYKESIKERDEYKCQNICCCCKQGHASVLTIHHIDYNKKNCMPNNLITLCRSCNSTANKDRQWHTDWYRTIINKKYKYNH